MSHPDPQVPSSSMDLPDAPVGLLRLAPDGRILGCNRRAQELLGCTAEVLESASSTLLWGLVPGDLADEEGIWTAPGDDPARCVCYQRDHDGGWWLSLPHARTAALLRDVAMLAGETPASVISPELQPLARRLREAADERRLLAGVAQALAGCDLELDAALLAGDSEIARRLAAGFGNLSEAIRQAVALSVQIASEVPPLVAENDELARQSQAQSQALERALEAARGLLESLQGVGGELQAVIEVAAGADASAREGVDAAHALGEAMREVEQRAARANGVIEVIDLVAFQTNILSINASIEAAHAGEAGRGFAVVATEIRRLAERAAEAARDVRGIIGQTVQAVSEGAASARRTEDTLNGIGALLGRASSAMETVAGRIRAQDGEVRAIETVVEGVVELGRSNLGHAASVAERSEALGHGSETLRDCVGLFRLPPDPMREPRHALVRELAVAASMRIGEALEQALARGVVGADALFSRDYEPVPGVEPAKYTTAFDTLCDELLPPLQEPVLAAQPWLVFAICANPDGYVPTHNLRFSQPLTGDPARDLVGNRTKRIFTDRVGRSVGAHTDPYRLQVYRRDTGQIMFDLSVPVFVGGKHWGGFRIGYTLE